MVFPAVNQQTSSEERQNQGGGFRHDDIGSKPHIITGRARPSAPINANGSMPPCRSTASERSTSASVWPAVTCKSYERRLTLMNAPDDASDTSAAAMGALASTLAVGGAPFSRVGRI